MDFFYSVIINICFVFFFYIEEFKYMNLSVVSKFFFFKNLVKRRDVGGDVIKLVFWFAISNR